MVILQSMSLNSTPGSQQTVQKQPVLNPQSKSFIGTASQKHLSSSQQNKEQAKSNCGCSLSHGHPFIGTREQAPDWMRYPDLTIGYRINFYSIKLIFKSLFILHNETINIWTHLLGALLLIFTAFMTCTEYIDEFQSQFHTPLLPHNNYAMGSGSSFCENMTQQCFNQSLLFHNNQSVYTLSDQDQLAYDVCQNHHQNKHECYLSKTHQRRFRNWLQLNSGIPLDKMEEIKLLMEKQIIPQFVHGIEETVYDSTHQLMDEIRNYFNMYTNETALEQNVEQINIQTSQQSIINEPLNLAKWPLVFYLLCNSITLICSVIFHWFYPLSKKAHQFCICTDFAGISFLFGFSPIPSIYYGMYCYFEVAELYLTAMIACSVLVFLVSFTDRFQDRQSSLFRVGIYFCLACLTVAPLTHMTINQLLFNNYNQTFSLSNSMTWYMLGLVFYAMGGFFYVSHVPNKFSKTGKYDFFGHSHQYWHVLIVMGQMTIYLGCLENYFTRKETGCAVQF